MNLDHPIVKKAWSVVNLREMAWQQAQEWDTTVAEMEALQPGDQTGEDVLRGAAILLQSIEINYGHHDWTVQQSWLIFQTAERVFGAGQLKFNRPTVSLSGNGPGASLFHGMRMKYRHSGGL